MAQKNSTRGPQKDDIWTSPYRASSSSKTSSRQTQSRRSSTAGSSSAASRTSGSGAASTQKTPAASTTRRANVAAPRNASSARGQARAAGSSRKGAPRHPAGRQSVHTTGRTASSRTPSYTAQHTAARNSSNRNANRSHTEGNATRRQSRSASASPRSTGARALRLPRRFVLIAAIIIVLLAAGLVDHLLYLDKIRPNISIGTVDVGGMTADEARAAVDAAYAQRVEDAQVKLFGRTGITDEEGAAALSEELAECYAAQTGWPQDLYIWTVTSTEIDASLPDTALVDEAMSKGRDLFDIAGKLGTALFGCTIDPYAVFSDAAIESLAVGIDSCIGQECIDSTIVIDKGSAYALEGADGYMVSRTAMSAAINEAIFADELDFSRLVLYAPYTPMRITYDDACSMAEKVNNTIGDGINIYYGDSGWQVTPTMVGNWLNVSTVTSGDTRSLRVSVDESTARSDMLDYINEYLNRDPVTVSFEKNGDSITVHATSEGTMPLITEAVADLNEAMFGENAQEAAAAIDGNPVAITINSTTVPSSMDLQTALDSGVVSAFGSYTTTYTSGATKEARNYNIHLMADLINNSIAEANGGIWSMNETSGPSDEAHGFKPATIILENEHVDAIGGGICQVATTVFNCAFECGFDIVERANHSLYVATYPAGRDAAVSYDDLDFKWRNDSTSDVLVTTSYTDTSLTVTFYGVSPGYHVTAEEGEWEKLEDYETKYILNKNLDEDTEVVTEAGIDSQRIQVHRTVYDKNGEVVKENTFTSTYDATTEIITIGPGKLAEEAEKEDLIIKTIEEGETE